MKRTEALAVGDILKAMIDCDGDSDEFNRQKACYIWGEVVGPHINQVTTRRYVEKDTLHVFISSAPLKSELTFMTAGLIEKINDAVGKKVIKKISIH